MCKSILDSRKQLQEHIDKATTNIIKLETTLPLIVPFGRFGSHPEDILLQLTFQQFIILWDRFLKRLSLEGTVP